MTKHRTPEEQESHMLRKEVEREMEELGVYDGLGGVPIPTKKEVAKNRKFTDEERALIYECLIDNDNNVEKALVDYNKFAADNEQHLKPATKHSLKQFRMRHIEDYCKAIAADVGLTTIMTIARGGKQEQTRSLASQYLMNRGYGMPTQHIDQKVEHYTWADVESEKAKALEQMGDSGVWEPAPDDPEPVSYTHLTLPTTPYV